MKLFLRLVLMAISIMLPMLVQAEEVPKQCCMAHDEPIQAVTLDAAATVEKLKATT